MKCEVLRKSYINDREVYPGEIIDYKGKEVGPNLRPLAAKEKAVKQMDHAELLAYAKDKDIELKDPDNMTDAEIATTITDALEKETI